MLNRWTSMLLMMLLTMLYGCDRDYYNRHPLYPKLLDMALNQPTKVDTLIDGEWEYVCLLPPYYGDVFRLENKVQSLRIERYISENDIPTWDGHWHLAFSNSEDLDFITFNRKNELDVKQRNFNKELIQNFTIKNFSPNACVFFHEAVFFKFIKTHQHDGKTYNRVYLTLGELKND